MDPLPPTTPPGIASTHGLAGIAPGGPAPDTRDRAAPRAGRGARSPPAARRRTPEIVQPPGPGEAPDRPRSRGLPTAHPSGHPASGPRPRRRGCTHRRRRGSPCHPGAIEPVEPLGLALEKQVEPVAPIEATQPTGPSPWVGCTGGQVLGHSIGVTRKLAAVTTGATDEPLTRQGTCSPRSPAPVSAGNLPNRSRHGRLRSSRCLAPLAASTAALRARHGTVFHGEHPAGGRLPGGDLGRAGRPSTTGSFGPGRPGCPTAQPGDGAAGTPVRRAPRVPGDGGGRAPCHPGGRAAPGRPGSSWAGEGGRRPGAGSPAVSDPESSSTPPVRPAGPVLTGRSARPGRARTPGR